jgi:hypothetical protein
MTSSNGTAWTVRSAAGNDDNWYRVVYGNGLFVAVGYQYGSDSIMTSPDGINWTARTVGDGSDDQWYRIAYGNGLFVAVGNGDGGSGGDRIMTSQDAITWTTRSALGNNDTWYGLTYANGLFVAFSSGDDYIMTSPDGITWTARSNPAPLSQFYDVTYGNGRFVVVSSAVGNDSVMTSTGPTATSSNTQNQITFTNPADTDFSSYLVLRSTSPVVASPTEGSTYSTSTTIGASTVVCASTSTASSSVTCTDTSLTNGTPYYYKIFTRDSSGNYSVGIDHPSPRVLFLRYQYSHNPGRSIPSAIFAPA